MSTPPYVINTCTVPVKLDNVDKLLDALTRLAAAVKEMEPTCIAYEFYQPEGQPEVVLLEKYPAEQDFYVHVAQPHTQIFLNEAKPLFEKEPTNRLSNGPKGLGGFAK